MKDSGRKTISLAIAVLVILLCWQLLAAALAKPFFPAPFKAFSALAEEISDGVIIKHTLVSCYRIILSMAVSFALALPLGMYIGRNKKADRILTPLTYVLYPIPKVVFLPVIVVLFGLGDFPKIFLITLVLFFQLLVVTRDASKAVPAEYVYSAKALGMSDIQATYKVVMPLCISETITSLRVGIGTAIAILFFAETFASLNGLGYYISDMMSRRSYDRMFAGIIMMALLGLALYGILYVAEKRLTKWTE